MLCELCNQPCGLYVRWHQDCWINYREFIENDFISLVNKLGKEQPAMTLYAISPEFREEMSTSLIRE